MWGLVVSRIQNRRHRTRSGALTIQFLVIMVPVVLGMMGFAVDLGRMYLIRGELNQAASAMAIAAASKLNGTVIATDTATTAAQATLDDSMSDANRYNFGSLVVGQGNALLTSAVQQPQYFQNVADAFAAVGQTGGGSADGTTAHHALVSLSADSPLTFWALLSLGQSRKTSIAAAAVAGLSAPVCTACGIEPFAVGAADPTDPVNFGFVAGTVYTLGSMCTGPAPALLAGTTALVSYLIIDRYNTGLGFDETQQLFRVGANGLIPSTTPALACSIIGTTENVWASTLPVGACGAATPNLSVEEAMCGVSARMTDPTQTAACTTNVTDLANLSAAYTPDTDTLSETDYTTYAGTGRRLLTLPVVSALSTTAATMQVMGFRQFLLEPTTTSTTSPQANVATDGDGRFVAMYVGTVAPVKQGNLSEVGQNISCAISNGPGKVVLFQ